MIRLSGLFVCVGLFLRNKLFPSFVLLVVWKLYKCVTCVPIFVVLLLFLADLINNKLHKN